jgi:hypothetical protein
MSQKEAQTDSEVLGTDKLIAEHYSQLLSLLFYNLCKCSKFHQQDLHPKLHSVSCKYKIEVEKANLKFEDE